MKIPTSNAGNLQPIHKIRYGAVSASIWRKDTSTGPMFNVTFQRSYKDGEVWKHSASFGRRDLLVLGLIAARSFEWIATQPRGAKDLQGAPKNEGRVPSLPGT